MDWQARHASYSGNLGANGIQTSYTNAHTRKLNAASAVRCAVCCKEVSLAASVM